MKENLLLGIKGFIIGIANIVPGVSGGTLAITLGIYEDLINAISHFFSDLKKNMKFLIPTGIGMVLSLLILSNVIGLCLENYPIPTTLFFIGLILGGIPLLFKNVKGHTKKASNWLYFVITFGIVLLFTFMNEGSNLVSFTNMNVIGYIMLFIVGVIAAATMVIPGISGSFMLMLLGYYEPIIDTIRSLTHFENILDNILILAPFGIGILVGIVLIAKIIEWLLKKFEVQTYFGILGFVISSIISIIVGINASLNIVQLIIGIILLIIGFIIAYRLGDE